MSIPELPLRTAQQVAKRLLATLICGAVAADATLRDTAIEWIGSDTLALGFSPKENAFLHNPRPSHHDVVQFTWYIEVAFVLGWAAGLLDTLPAPTQESSIKELLTHVPRLGEPVTSFIENTRLRAAAEIYGARQSLEDLHARARSDQARDRIMRHATNLQVAQEQHRTLNWLACNENADWDQVSTDT